MARNRHENYIVRTLNGLAYGYFVSVVFGIILKQIGTAIHINMLYQWGVMLGYLMGPAIGIAMGLCIDARGMNLLTALLAGTIGAGTIVVDGGQISLATGNPLLAYIAVILAIEVGRLVQGKTPFDIWLVPVMSIGCAGLVVWFIGPFMHQISFWLNSVMKQCAIMPSVLMGMLVALLAGVITTSPLSSLLLTSIMVDFNGVVLGAVLAGVCSQMIGFAVMSMNDNRFGEVLAIGLGTSLLQFKNIVKRPVIWIPPLLASMLSGMISVLFSLRCNVQGSAMGLTGLLGLTDSFSIMATTYWIPLFLIDVVLPMVVCYSIYKAFRKLNYIKNGDLQISQI